MAKKIQKLRKRYQIAGNRASVQDSLIARAEQIGLRKGLVFVGAVAQWLRDVADGTAQRIFEPVGAGVSASDKTILLQIDRAMRIFRSIVENAAKQLTNVGELSVTLMQEILVSLSPAPPVTD